MSVPKVLQDAFAKFAPDILPMELDAEKCVEIIADLAFKADASGHDNHRNEIERLRTRLKLCQEELSLALLASEDIRALKVKAAHIMDQFTREKENALHSYEKQKVAERRAEILVSHTEKLMKCLKAEATSKVKQIEQNRRERKLSFNLTQRINKKDGIIGTQKRLIMELREGAHIMEGQLRMMDDRFYELRTKLDTARHNQRFYVEKYQKQCKDLRAKFTAIHGPRYSLDSVVVPEGYEVQKQQQQSAVDFFGTGDAQEQQMNSQSPNIGPGRVRPSTSNRANSSSGGGKSSGNVNAGTNAIPGSEGLSRTQMEMLRSGTGKKSTGRASTAPGGKRRGKGEITTGAKKEHTWGFQPSGDDDKDVDILITKIYNKSKMNEEDRWTPAALTKLVADEHGNVGCKIPNIIPKDKMTDSERYNANRRSQLEGEQ
jgi:hypothetical protein